MKIPNADEALKKAEIKLETVLNIAYSDCAKAIHANANRGMLKATISLPVSVAKIVVSHLRKEYGYSVSYNKPDKISDHIDITIIWGNA